MHTIVSIIDTVNEKLGTIFMWLMVFLIVIVTYDVLMRYLFNKPSVWVYELALIIGSAAYLLSWGDTERLDKHLRVDIFYSRCSPKWKAIINVLGTVICWYPLFIAYMVVSIPWAIKSWRVGEKMMESYWYPPFGPTRTVIIVGLCLFTMQITANLIRNIHILKTGEQL